MFGWRLRLLMRAITGRRRSSGVPITMSNNVREAICDETNAEQKYASREEKLLMEEVLS